MKARFAKTRGTNLTHRLLQQRSVLLVSLLCLVGFLLLAVFKSSLASVNADVNSWAASIQTSSLTPVAVAISDVFDTEILLPISLVVAAVLFFSNYREYSPLVLGAMGGDAVILLLSKALIHSPRPTDALVYDASNSFPSGEVTSCIVFFGILAYLAWQIWKTSSAKPLSGAVFVAMVSVVGFDRIYLNIHWFTDVLGGCLLGAFWLTFSILVFHYLVATDKLPSFLVQNRNNRIQASQ